MNSRKLWNMQKTGISRHLSLSTQIEGNLMLYLSSGYLMALLHISNYPNLFFGRTSRYYICYLVLYLLYLVLWDL
ncbi:hypothetical protein Zm00014a_033679 [Zea mays]|uniref:Uncharacterized protein n=1 Tax=Zea mays TaxID=4577 RepID=A0A3L6G067_MAIZE|nr:hypothetical protein Zm00014a_033679 [Zea mays]